MAISYPPARPNVQADQPDEALHRKSMAHAINRLSSGHGNTSVFITLDPGVATTTIEDARISAQTSAGFMPQTANAAAELPNMWIVATNGTLVIHHTNSPLTDRTFTTSLTG